VLYLYAITESPEVPEDRGLRGSPLRAVTESALHAIVSEHEDLRIEASEDDLWAHENVVESLMKRGSVLPMRLGSSVPDEAAVRDLLTSREEEFRRALERVRGAVELGVRAVAAPVTRARTVVRRIDPLPVALALLVLAAGSAALLRLVHQTSSLRVR
jgi:hypothetical protein